MQYRYHDYLTEIRSKKASEAIAIPVGIGPIFGYNVISYDGSILMVTADPAKNYRYNLTNERMVLVNPHSGCITPDGILTVETSDIQIPLILGSFTGSKEVAIIANHVYSKEEGGTVTTYRAYVNPDQNSWVTKLKEQTANMETWLKLLEGSLRRNQEVILGICRIEKVGEDHRISSVLNPYSYTWGVSTYVPLDRYESDMENLKQLIPIFDQKTIQLSNKEIAVATRDYTNGASTALTGGDYFNLDSFTLSKLGDALDMLFNFNLNFTGKAVDLSKQILVTMDAEMDYIMPTAIEPKFQSPIAFSWLKASTENPDSGERIQQHTHAVYGTLSLNTNKFHLQLTLYPIKGNQGSIADNLYLKGELVTRIAMMAQLSEMFDVQLGVTSEQGTTGTGDVSGAGRYRRGSLVTVTASPAIGSGFVGWYEGNTILSTEQSYRFEIQRSVSYTAMFNGSSTKVKISVEVEPAGKATIKGEGMYAINTQCTLQCTPSTGYGFDYWEMAGVKYTINPLTFGVSKAATVKCKLTAPKRNVSLFSNPSGIFNLSGGGAYEVGSNVTLNATVLNSEYEFKGWYKNSYSASNLLSTNPNYSFKMPDNDMSIMAYGEKKAPTPTGYTVAVSGEYGGTTYGGGTYNPGSVANIYCNVYSDYEFVEWLIGGPNGSHYTSERSFNVTVESDLAFYAKFKYVGGGGGEPTNYVLTTAVGPPAGGTVIGGGTYAEGSYARITATPNAGYIFKNWAGDASGSNNPESVYMNGNKAVTAQFELKGTTYTLTMNTSTGGTVTPKTGEYPMGQNVQVNAIPSAGYVFDRWEGPVTGANTIALNNVLLDGPKTLTAWFKAVPTTYYDLKVVTFGSTGSTTTPSGTTSQPANAEVKIYANPAAGKQFDYWQGDGVHEGNKYGSPLRLTMDGPKTVYAFFSDAPAVIPKTKSLRITNGTSSSMTVEVTQPYHGSQSVTIGSGNSSTVDVHYDEVNGSMADPVAINMRTTPNATSASNSGSSDWQLSEHGGGTFAGVFTQATDSQWQVTFY